MSALKTYRERKGLSLAQLGAMVGTTAATLSRIENGKREASVGLIKRLIAASEGELTPADFISHADRSPNVSEGAAA